MRIDKIFLYDEPSVPEIKLDKLSDFLEEVFCVKVVKRDSIFRNATSHTAEEIAASRIFNFRAQFEPHTPTPEEIRFEQESFEDSSKIENIVPYDGLEFQNAVAGIIPEEEATLHNLHIAFTNRLTCTFDDGDYRYHGRALIGTNPSVISTTGIVEAPAKPRQYYLDLMANYSQGLNVDSIKDKYRGQYLEYHDQRLDKIVQGYCMQAVFYHITGQPFCDLLDCRLHNAHWQRDLLYSQIEVGRICEWHSTILSEWIALNNLNC